MDIEEELDNGMGENTESGNNGNSESAKDIDIDLLSLALKDLSIEEKKTLVINAIKYSIDLSPKINKTQILINSVYHILSALIVEDKQIVLLDAPTGSGKSIIGYCVHHSINHIAIALGVMSDTGPYLSYYLTPSKALQTQIDNDLVTFNFIDEIKMLKGTSNYECFVATKMVGQYQSYADRACIGMTSDQINGRFGCLNDCEYKVKREEVAKTNCAVLNYAYFLNINRGPNPFFGKRYLTICDEGHMLPNIVLNTFNYEFTLYATNLVDKMINSMMMVYGNNKNFDNIKIQINKIFEFFNMSKVYADDILNYFNSVKSIYSVLVDISSDERYAELRKQILKNIERLLTIITEYDRFAEMSENRPEDMFITSTLVTDDKSLGNGVRIYKHSVKDLSEHVMVQDHFFKFTHKCLLMSATFGNIEEFAITTGLKPENYSALSLPDKFNYDRSPIYLCNSGYLNHKNFDANIDKVIMDTCKIIEQLHPKEKGIVHTATFKITELLKQRSPQLLSNPKRLLFYKTAEEKEEMIQTLKNSLFPYVIVGPSLNEGIDLKDDYGRFNILMKVPYGMLDDYIKAKMIRYPFAYKRETIEKIIQEIGRTNRHIEDYSSCYLLDNGFNSLIFETNNSIIGRLTKKYL